MGDPVLHIELRRWADVFVIAPLDANTLAKIRHAFSAFASDANGALTVCARAVAMDYVIISCRAWRAVGTSPNRCSSHLR